MLQNPNLNPLGNIKELFLRAINMRLYKCKNASINSDRCKSKTMVLPTLDYSELWNSSEFPTQFHQVFHPQA
jgi:hypothetical protein